MAHEGDSGATAPGSCRVVVAGPARFDVVRDAVFLTGSGPSLEKRPAEARRLESIVFRNHPAFTALYDGHTLALAYDRRALATAARAVERTWAEAFGEGFVTGHRGALLYLTKYFTPHPPGEPHFFVKPWAFTLTPPGWSSLIEGFHGDGYDVMRGVISTDVFHATPAVFHVRREGSAIRVGDGAPLLRVLPIPRRLLAAGFRTVALPDAL